MGNSTRTHTTDAIMKLSDYLHSNKPAKLMMIDQDGNETSDYLEVISINSATVARKMSKWSTDRALLAREVKEIEARSVDDELLSADVERRAEILNFEIKNVNVEFAYQLVTGSSFGEINDSDLIDLLNEGVNADAVIALSNDPERLKKK